MRKVVLYIAMSLDGYIADSRGGVDWLMGQGCEEEMLDTYSAFIQTVDTVIMGWNTYHQIVTELSPEEWVYAGQKSYVITHRQEASSNDIMFTAKDPCRLVKELQQEEGKQIWICGGAKLAQQLIKADLIDEYDISVIPVILGSGIRLFEAGLDEIKLKLVHTQIYNGIAELTYTRRENSDTRL